MTRRHQSFPAGNLRPAVSLAARDHHESAGSIATARVELAFPIPMSSEGPPASGRSPQPHLAVAANSSGAIWVAALGAFDEPALAPVGAERSRGSRWARHLQFRHSESHFGSYSRPAGVLSGVGMPLTALASI